MHIHIGTRKSTLALKQVDEILALLEKTGQTIECSVTGIDTRGDRDKQTPLAAEEGTDFFTAEIEAGLLDNTIDLAIHSAKDLPDRPAAGLKIACITEGIDNRDVLVLRKDATAACLADVPPGCRIGTSSRRREDQVLKHRPDVTVCDIRGNIEERLDLLDSGAYDALVIAAAGLIRLDRTDRISEYLDFETPFLQGKLAVQVREDNTEIETLCAPLDYRKKLGTVYLVGAGPGPAELLTVKARNLLLTADVIVYDSLVNVHILDEYSAPAVYVGKRKNNHSKTQEEINQLLLKYASTIPNGNIIRLKGGDPCIFGRGGEETAFLRKNFIPYEVVPGITAAVAAAHYSDIPLTCRGVSSSVSFCTGHPVDKIMVPAADTLVYYMAATSIIDVTRTILESDRPGDTPAAIISNAARPGQQTVITTLDTIMQDSVKPESPAILIVGNVVSLYPGKSWFDLKKKILFTGTTPEKYTHMGEIYPHSLIQLVPPDNYELIDTELENLDTYTMIVFTSKHGVRFFFSRLQKTGRDTRYLGGKTVCALGRVTAGELHTHGIIPDLQPHFESAAGLIDVFHKNNITGQQILLPVSNLAHQELPASLRHAGNNVTVLTVYKNILPASKTKVDLNNYDSIYFTSPSGVRNFFALYNTLPDHLEPLTIGDVTQQELEHETISPSA